jgi:hypothetical protein
MADAPKNLCPIGKLFDPVEVQRIPLPAIGRTGKMTGNFNSYISYNPLIFLT